MFVRLFYQLRKFCSVYAASLEPCNIFPGMWGLRFQKSIPSCVHRSRFINLQTLLCFQVVDRHWLLEYCYSWQIAASELPYVCVYKFQSELYVVNRSFGCLIPNLCTSLNGGYTRLKFSAVQMAVDSCFDQLS